MKRTGRLWVTHKNNFVLLRGRGPWTKESLIRFAESTPSLDFNFEQPWGTLACLYGESILTPAAKDSFIRSHHWMVKKKYESNCGQSRQVRSQTGSEAPTTSDLPRMWL